MATSKISGMPALSVALTGSEETEVAKSGVSYRLTMANLFKTIGVLADAGTPTPASGYRIALYKISDGQPYSTTLSEILTAGTGSMPGGGTTGQQLVKLSNDDYDAAWVDDPAVPQAANTVLAGPTTGADADPTFRALVSADLPTIAIAQGGTGATTASGARTALGLEIGADVQAYSSVLAATTASFLTAQETKLGYITVTQAVDLDAIETRVNALDAAVVLQGSWDASAGTFPGSGAAQAGDSYIVSTGGTVDSVDFTANDRIVAITDNASTSTYASNWLKLDYTDQVLSVAGRTGAVTLAQADISGLTTADSPQFAGVNVGAATDTTITRVSAGVVAVEGDTVLMATADIGTTVQAYSSVLANTTASFTTADETKLDGIEAGADVTDETNVKAALDGATTAAVTPASGDKILLLDVSDSDNLKHALFSDFSGGGGSSGHGQCRLTLSGGNLVLAPYNGDQILINGTAETIPTAGVSLAATSLSAGTTYFIYVYMSGATMTLEASTTTHATDTSTSGNLGVEIKSADATRTLVGMARPTTGPAWTDSAAQRFVISYFNRRNIAGASSLSANRTTTSTSYVEINSEIRNEFLTWSDDGASFVCGGISQNDTTNQTATSSIGIDGTTAEDCYYSAQAFAGGADLSFCVGLYKSGMSEGYHYATLLGKVSANTGTWKGSGTAGARVALTSMIRG